MQTFLHENARNVGRNAEAEVDAAIGLQFLRHTVPDHLLYIEFRHSERFQGT